MALPKEYDDLPGTMVFDADQRARGLPSEHVLHVADEGGEPRGVQGGRARLSRSWPMTEEQKQAILKRDWNGMLELGGNIYFTAKLARDRRAVVPADRRHDDRARPRRSTRR